MPVDLSTLSKGTTVKKGWGNVPQVKPQPIITKKPAAPAAKPVVVKKVEGVAGGVL